MELENNGSPVWVLDTNVIVSAFLSASSPPAWLVDAAIAGRCTLAYDDRILLKYVSVLSRPKLKITPAARDAFLAELAFHQHITTPPSLSPKLPDPDDLPFLQVAAATEKKVLVTGNVKHFPKKLRGKVEVLSPREAWERLCDLSS